MRLFARFYIFAYAVLIITVMLLPFTTDAGLSFFSDSLSNLGAHQTSGNWAMNITFMLMSLATLLYGISRLTDQGFAMITLVFFCVCFFLTGYYQMAGKNPLIHYNYSYDALHSLFLLLSGIGFSVLCFAIFLRTVKVAHKLLTVVILAFAILLPFLQFQLPEYRGVFQRIMFIICFGWLFYALTAYSFTKKKPGVYERMRKYKKLNKQLTRNEK